MASVGAKKRAKQARETRLPIVQYEHDKALGPQEVFKLLLIRKTDGEEAYMRALRSQAKSDGPYNCVYFARMGTTDAVKVGFSAFGMQRLALLQCNSPVEMTFSGYVNFSSGDHMAAAEAMAHAICDSKAKWIRGEWYRMDDKTVGAVARELVSRNENIVVGAAWAKGE